MGKHGGRPGGEASLFFSQGAQSGGSGATAHGRCAGQLAVAALRNPYNPSLSVYLST